MIPFLNESTVQMNINNQVKDIDEVTWKVRSLLCSDKFWLYFTLFGLKSWLRFFANVYAKCMRQSLDLAVKYFVKFIKICNGPSFCNSLKVKVTHRFYTIEGYQRRTSSHMWLWRHLPAQHQWRELASNHLPMVDRWPWSRIHHILHSWLKSREKGGLL